MATRISLQILIRSILVIMESPNLFRLCDENPYLSSPTKSGLLRKFKILSTVQVLDSLRVFVGGRKQDPATASSSPKRTCNLFSAILHKASLDYPKSASDKQTF